MNVEVDCDGDKKSVPLYWLLNKAGYMANTNCGQVGRGGNARFHTFQLDHHDQRTNGRTDGRTDKAFYRVACPQLKKD